MQKSSLCKNPKPPTPAPDIYLFEFQEQTHRNLDFTPTTTQMLHKHKSKHQQLSEEQSPSVTFFIWCSNSSPVEVFATGPAQLQPRASSPLCLHVMRLGICALVTSTQRICLLVKPEVSFRNIQFPETRRQLYFRQTVFYSLSAFISSSKAQAVLYSPTHFTNSSFTSFSPRCASTRNFSSVQLNFESAAAMSW